MRFGEWVSHQLDALRAIVGVNEESSVSHSDTSTSPSALKEKRTPSKLELDFPSSTAQLAPVRRAIESFALEAGLDKPACEEIGLVVNEALANVIRHAYAGKTDRPIRATAEKVNGGVKIALRDWGNGVDPTTVPRPEKDPLIPGGLGLICMRRLMDEVHYEPQKDGMLLVMTRTASDRKSCPID